MSELRTNRIVPRDGLPSGSAGGVIQVKQAVSTDTNSQTGGIATALTNFEGITGLFCTITPTRSDSKILVQMNISASISVDNNILMFRIRRKIGGGSFSDLSGGFNLKKLL